MIVRRKLFDGMLCFGRRDLESFLQIQGISLLKTKNVIGLQRLNKKQVVAWMLPV
jgi:hypothetical protein